MKKWIVYFFVLTMIAPVSCKKGEDDPSVTLRTRKNRLTGTWNIESYAFTSTFGDIRSITFDPSLGLTYSAEDSTSYTREFSWDITFDSDGLYASIQKEDFPQDTLDGSDAYALTTNEKGIWEFTGGNSSPSKSKLALFPEEVSSTRTDQGSNIEITITENTTDAFVYDIDRLTNKELWLSYEVKQVNAFEERVEKLELKFSKTD